MSAPDRDHDPATFREYSATMPSTGIYAIFGPNDKVYVGQSVNIANRWREHKRKLGRGTHHCKPLQAAWNKYGSAVFRFEVLVVADADALTRHEQAALDSFAGRIYNTAPVAASMRGYQHTDEAKAKMKGRPGIWTGKNLSEETRKKIGATRRARGIGNPGKGKPMPPEQRAKMEKVWAAARGRPSPKKGIPTGKPAHNAGKPLSDEQRAKLSATRIARGLGGHPAGWKHSDVAREKMSAAARKRWHGE